MTTQMTATVVDGMLKPDAILELPEQSRVIPKVFDFFRRTAFPSRPTEKSSTLSISSGSYTFRLLDLRIVVSQGVLRDPGL